jgi:hypothetical protein
MFDEGNEGSVEPVAWPGPEKTIDEMRIIADRGIIYVRHSIPERTEI